MVQDVTKSVGRVVDRHVFLHFILQEELIASKVIPLQCTKLIVRVSYLLEFFERFTEIDLADNITKEMSEV